MEKISKRLWITIILVGLVGQFAWTIENMYFNVFLYNTISTDPKYISAMVGWSAAAATLTTLLMGALSDRVGKRKIFICGGYILWGLSTASFGFISIENAAAFFPAQAGAAAAIMVVVMDCVMTFFGSTANDAAFNAYITDTVSEQNRGKSESVIAILPLISMLIIFGAFDGMTQKGEWKAFFGIFGFLVTVVGIISSFLIKEPVLETKKEPYLKNLVYGFRPTVVKANSNLYLALTAFSILSCAVQVWMPFLIIYLQNYLKIDAYAIILGIALTLASAVSVVSGRIIDKVGKVNFVLPAAGVMIIGLTGMFIARTLWPVTIAGTIMMSGYMLLTASLSAVIRDTTPSDKVGLFQGIRMIFGVLLPMIIGPAIGSAVIRNSDSTYVDLGVVKTVPTPAIFAGAAVVLVFLIIPVMILKKREKSV